MSDELVAQLRARTVQCTGSPHPDHFVQTEVKKDPLCAKAADRIKELEAERDRLRSHIHRLCSAGGQFAAYMHPNDDQAKISHASALRKWQTVADDATCAAMKGQTDDTR